jgi:DUF1680 family protein
LWLATADNGLCASVYLASDVVAKVGDGAEVKWTVETDYPFADTVTMKLSTPKAVKFPLYLRVPQWCDAPQVRVNDKPVDIAGARDRFITIDRTWADGDTIALMLPMTIKTRVWHKNHDSISVDRGPLTYALQIGTDWRKYGGSDAWPEFEVRPTTPWNYGLVLDQSNLAGSLQVTTKESPLGHQPFTPKDVPVRLTAKAKRIPQWTTDSKELLHPLQTSPVKSDQAEESVTLIPMGAARLRIASFPVIGQGPEAHEWASAKD